MIPAWLNTQMIPLFRISVIKNDLDKSSYYVDQFLRWSKDTRMSCNPNKCKELVFRKRALSKLIKKYARVNEIEQYDSLKTMGVT